MQQDIINKKINILLKDNLLVPLNSPASDVADMLLEDGPSEALRALLFQDTLQEGEDIDTLANLASELIQAMREEAYTWESYYEQATSAIRQEELEMAPEWEGGYYE